MDVKLSKRMQTVADMITEKRVVDIGCDHAFVSIYLAQKPFVQKVIAMDVKVGPVDIAKANVMASGLYNKIEVRMSDGFSKLIPGEVDAAIIAGMGGHLMVDILKAGIEHLKGGISLVLQPQSDIRLVREYLLQVGYDIVCENMLIEDGKYYTVIKAMCVNGKTPEYSVAELNYGPYLLKHGNSVLRDYLEFLKSKNQDIIEKLACVDSEKSQDRISQLKLEQDGIDNILEKYFLKSI